jgi:hypothetical protein
LLALRGVGLTSAGLEANGASDFPSINSDGTLRSLRKSRWEPFRHAVIREKQNVYVGDRWSDTTLLATVGSDGSAAIAPSYAPVLSADGRVVAFISKASNLVPSDVDGLPDVFVVDLGILDDVSCGPALWPGKRPVAQIAPPPHPTVSQAVTLDGSGSLYVVPNGYAWSLVAAG